MAHAMNGLRRELRNPFIPPSYQAVRAAGFRSHYKLVILPCGAPITVPPRSETAATSYRRLREKEAVPQPSPAKRSHGARPNVRLLPVRFTFGSGKPGFVAAPTAGLRLLGQSMYRFSGLSFCERHWGYRSFSALRENTPTPNLASWGEHRAHADANHPQPSAFSWIFGKMGKRLEASGPMVGSGGGIQNFCIKY